MAFKHNEGIKVFKALADDNRLEIIELLMNGELCACELLEQLKIGQSTLSHHMHILCEADLVDSRKQGKWMYYSLSAVGSRKARELMEHYTVSPDKAESYPGQERNCRCC